MARHYLPARHLRAHPQVGAGGPVADQRGVPAGPVPGDQTGPVGDPPPAARRRPDRTVNEIETALRGLRRRGLVTEEVTRTPGSGRRITSRQRRFRRDLVIAPDGQLLDGESAIQDLTCDDDKTAGRLLNGEWPSKT